MVGVHGVKASRGHAVLPHTADVQIEAWAPTQAGCYEEAVAAFLDIFTDSSRASVLTRLPFEVGPGDPRDLLVQLLEEAVVIVETAGVAPVEAHVDVLGDRLVGSFSVAPVDEVELTGSIPKGISYEELSFKPEHGRWHCLATVDV